MSENSFLRELKKSKFIAVDLDIYRNYLPSIGHHILTLGTDDILPQHKNSLNPNLARNNIIKLLHVIEKNIGLNIPAIPLRFKSIRGERSILNLIKEEQRTRGFLRNFLVEHKVFSYVISNKNIINYTTNIDFR